MTLQYHFALLSALLLSAEYCGPDCLSKQQGVADSRSPWYAFVCGGEEHTLACIFIWSLLPPCHTCSQSLCFLLYLLFLLFHQDSSAGLIGATRYRHQVLYHAVLITAPRTSYQELTSAKLLNTLVPTML